MPDYMLFFLVWIGGGLWFFFTNKANPEDYKQYSSPRTTVKKPTVSNEARKPIPKRKSNKRAKKKTTLDEAKPIRKRKRTTSRPNKSPKSK